MLISRTVFPKGSGQQLFNCTATSPTRSLARTEGQREEADHRTWQRTHCWPPPRQPPQTSQHTYVFGSQELHPIGHLEAEAELFMPLTVLLSALLPTSSMDVATFRQWLAISHPFSLQCLPPEHRRTCITRVQHDGSL